MTHASTLQAAMAVGVIKVLGTVAPVAPNSKAVSAHSNPMGLEVSDSEYCKETPTQCVTAAST